MPTRMINGAQIHYEDVGTGPETIVFSHGLLMSGEMFEAQAQALSGRYRCISYDHRGQARSEVAKSGYDMDSLTSDAAALIRDQDERAWEALAEAELEEWAELLGLRPASYAEGRLALQQALREHRLDDDVEVMVDTYPGEVFAGKVSYIADREDQAPLRWSYVSEALMRVRKYFC